MFKNILKTKKLKFFAVFCMCFIAFFGVTLIAHAGVEGILTMIIGFPLNLLTMVLGLAVKIAGCILDWALSPTSFSLIRDNAVINIGWQVTRDFVNMFFILILLIVAFAKVLGISKYQEDKIIVRLVIAAFLINFSKVICGFMIDAANVLTTFFVKGIPNGSIGGNLANALSIQNLFATNFAASAKPNNFAILLTLCFINIILAISAAIFLYLAIMLVIRMVYLWILVMLSPLAWFGWILSGNFNFGDWWNKFWDNLSKAPIAAFGLYLTIQIANTPGGLAAKINAKMPESTSIINTFANSLNMILQYIIIISLLYLTYQSTKKGSGIVGSKVGTWAKKGKDKALDWGKRLGGGITTRIAEKPRAAIQKFIEKQPIIGEAIGDVGAYAAKQKGEVGKIKTLYTNRTADDWKGILKKTPVTKKDMQTRTALLELLASKGKLKNEHKQFVKDAQTYGVDMKVILGAKPEWAPDFKTKKDIDEKKSNQDILNDSFAKMSPKSLAETSFNLADIEKDDKVRAREIKNAITNAINAEKINSSHFSALSNSENVDLASEMKDILNNGLAAGSIKKTKALNKFFNSTYGALWLREKESNVPAKETKKTE